MPNVNITRNTTDTQDNVRYTTPIQKTDFRGITLLVISIFITITGFWMIALGFATVGCWIAHTSPCQDASYIFWGYILIVAIATIVGLFLSIPAIQVVVENMKYRTWRGVITHRDDLRNNAPDIIAVARESARSEATAGMDNYSPSISKTQSTPADSVDDPMALKIPILDIGEDEIP